MGGCVSTEEWEKQMVAMSTPESIAYRVENHVSRLTFGRIRDLRIAMQAGRVVLEGRSETYYAKQLAQHGVLEVLPDVVVENTIEVR